MDDILFNILFSILFVLVPYMAIALLSCADISLRRFSIPSLFIIFYLLYSYIGIFILYFGWNSYVVSLGVVDKTVVFKLFIYSSTALIMIICGFIYAHRVLQCTANVNRCRVVARSNVRQRIFMFCLFLLCTLVLLAYLQQIQTIAIFSIFNGNSKEAYLIRSQMGNDFAGKYWRYEFFFHFLLNYCVVYFFADYLIMRNRVAFLLFLVMFLVASFTAIMAIEKGPFVNLLLLLYLAYVIYTGGKYWQSASKYVFIATMSILVIFYLNFMNAPDIVTALNEIVTRIFTGQISPAYFYIDWFPRHMEFLFGRSFPNPGGLLPFQPFPLTTMMSTIIFPEHFLKGVIGSAPTVFWAEMYANFGIVGVIFSSFLVGVWLVVISHFLSRYPLTPITIATISILAMHYRTLTGTSFSNYIFDVKLFIIVAITFMVLSLKKGAIRSNGAS